MRATLPDFVGIGALKAGTTFLDQLLRGHPELSFPRFMKETEYFASNYERGPDWYAGLFPPSDGRPCGEISPQYMSDPRCPDRIFAANPAVRIIASLRNPVDRAVSQYRHFVQETGYAKDFTAFLEQHPGAVERSEYFRLLERWLRRFDRSQLRVIVFDDLVAEPLATAQAVFTFLEVDDTYRPPRTDEAANLSFTPRFPRAYVSAKRLSRALYSINGGRVVHLVKRSDLHTKLRAHREEPSSPGIPAAAMDGLAQRLRPDVDRLSALLERNLTAEWRLDGL